MISVCIATYNGGKYISEQIKSILKQLNNNDEIIISDDGSIDDTLEIINEIKDSRIKVFNNDGKHGFVGNFENALSKAIGDYIFLCDQDDVWIDNKVEVVMNYLENYDFVVHDCYQTDSDLNIIHESRFKLYNLKPGFWRLLYKMRFIGCCMAFNRKVLDSCLPFPEKHNLLEHDTWFMLIAERYFKYALINDKLIYYRRHGANTSDGGLKSSNTLSNMIYRRIYKYNQVIRRKKKIKEVKK